MRFSHTLIFILVDWYKVNIDINHDHWLGHVLSTKLS